MIGLRGKTFLIGQSWRVLRHRRRHLVDDWQAEREARKIKEEEEEKRTAS